MMTLAQVSAFFDRMPVYDPDNGEVLFYGQVDPYDDSKRDAGAAYRRVLSVAPGTPIPAHRALRLLGSEWLAGNMEPDGLAELHRQKYVLQPAHACGVTSLSGYLAGSASTPTWGGVEWFKDGKEVSESSEMFALYNGYFGEGLGPAIGSVVQAGNQVFLVRSLRRMPAGFDVAVLAEQQSRVAQASLVRRVFVPQTGGMTSSAPVQVPALRMRWQDLFEYTVPDPERHRPGDETLVLPAATQVSNADRIELEGQTWSVLDVSAVYGVKACHVRRA